MSLPPPGSTIDHMQSLAYATPLLPGQSEASRSALASCQSGAHKEGHQDFRRRAGIIREAVWLQAAPGGDLAVVYLEADDLGTAFRILGSSPAAFDRWLRDHLRQVHGIALEKEFAPPELVLDFDTNRI